MYYASSDFKIFLFYPLKLMKRYLIKPKPFPMNQFLYLKFVFDEAFEIFQRKYLRTDKSIYDKTIAPYFLWISVYVIWGWLSTQ